MKKYFSQKNITEIEWKIEFTFVHTDEHYSFNYFFLFSIYQLNREKYLNFILICKKGAITFLKKKFKVELGWFLWHAEIQKKNPRL